MRSAREAAMRGGDTAVAVGALRLIRTGRGAL